MQSKQYTHMQAEQPAFSSAHHGSQCAT
jgi:hypothetical protein